jgi:hypothetical protein
MKTRNQLLNKLYITLLLTGCFIGFVVSTNPNKVALPLLIVPFVLLGFVLYQLVSVVLLFSKVQKNSYLGRIIALSIASLGVGLLLLQSLHQLTWRDSLLTGVFAVLFWLYIWRADFLHK